MIPTPEMIEATARAGYEQRIRVQLHVEPGQTCSRVGRTLAWNELPEATKEHERSIGIAALTAAFSAAWRPIESAPRDGTRLWLYFPLAHPDDRQVVGWWHNDEREPCWMDHADHHFEQPTHWQLLPPPPEERKGDVPQEN